MKTLGWTIGMPALVVGLLLTAGTSTSQASPVNVLTYFFNDMGPALDTDGGHVYTIKAPADPCWTSIVCLQTFDVIVVGDQLGGGAQIVADLSNATVQAATIAAGGRAVLGQLFRRTGAAGEKQLYTQSVEWAGTGPGVGWVSAFENDGEYNFTPFSPGIDLTDPTSFTASNGHIVNALHPIVAGMTDANLNWTVRRSFDVLPAGFGIVAHQADFHNVATLLAADFPDPVVGEVPEPASLLLLGSGLLGLARARRRRTTS